MALLTSILVLNWLAQLEIKKPEFAKVQTSMVAVALQEEPWGTQLTAEMLKLVPFPNESLPQGYFSALESLEGRVLLTKVTTNEPILESKLAPLDVTTGGVAAVTDPEKRAMAVKVDEVVGVAGFVNPGNRVDVLVTFRQEPPVTKIVLQNVLVLAIGTEIERRGKEQEALPVKVITLEVTPQEAEKLALASTEGKLRLALRNQLNSQAVLTKGETLPSVLSSYRLSQKVKKNGQVVKAKKVKVEVVKDVEARTLTFTEAEEPGGTMLHSTVLENDHEENSSLK
jgi:pilus assembly protein CpaB